jgi:AtzE family amidohydrolase
VSQGITAPQSGANAIAKAVTTGRISAVEVTRAALARVAAHNDELNCLTEMTAARALAEAEEVDRISRSGGNPGLLAGVPYVAKNLFNITGLPTLAGSKIGASSPASATDATLVARMTRAGAILIGASNMDEYAYGFTTENTYYGPARNPHDRDRVAGGSSGGSAAAVAAGFVPLALGSDTNGSIRVPASLCGVFGLKPTFGRLSRAGTQLFAPSLDHVGPLARSTSDLALCYDVLQGPDRCDPICAQRPVEPVTPELGKSISDLRIAIAEGAFEGHAAPETFQTLGKVAAALQIRGQIKLPELARSRAAATLITAAEAANLHLAQLRKRAADYDPKTRDRFLAGALTPSAWYLQAQRFRRWFLQQLVEVFRTVDVLVAPATPYPAPFIGQETIDVGGATVPARRHLGIFTQPLSFIGVPVIVVPVEREPGALPLGVQIIAAPWNEALVFRVAAAAEAAGVLAAPIACRSA